MLKGLVHPEFLWLLRVFCLAALGPDRTTPAVLAAVPGCCDKAAVLQFRLCFPHAHTIITVPESPMFHVPEAASVTTPRLALLKEAGQQYAANGTVNDALMQAITAPMIPEEQYAAIVNGSVT